MALSVGSAGAEFILNIDAYRKNFAELQKGATEIDRLRAQFEKPITLPAASGGAGDGRAQQQAAQAQQRLATEQQRTAVTAQRLATEEQRTAAATAGAAAAATRAESAVVRLGQAQASAATGSRGLGSAVQDIGGKLQGAIGAVSAFSTGIGAIALAKGAFDLGASGQAAAGARQSFDALAKSANTTGDALLGKLRQGAQGAIADSQLIQSANTGLLLTSGKIATDLPNLLEIARASARATGQDVGFVFDSLVKGIARGSPQIIDNAGITLDAAGAFKTYAQSIGKATDQLTNADQQQATLNAVLAAGNAIVAQTGAGAGAAANGFQIFGAGITNAKDALAGLIAQDSNGFFGTLGNGLNAIASNLSAFGSAAGQTAAAAQTAFTNTSSFDTYTAKITEINALLAGTGQSITPLTTAQYAYAQSLVATGVAGAAAVTQAQAQGEAAQVLLLTGQQLKQVDADRAAGLDALGGSILQVASYGAQEQANVLGLLGAYAEGTLAADRFQAALDVLIAGHTAAAAAAANDAAFEAQRTGEINAGTSATQMAASATQINTQALIDQTMQSQSAALQTQQLSAFQATLASLGGAVAGGLQTSAAAAAALANQYNITAQEAYKLIDAQAKLGQAKVNAGAFQDQRAGERGGGTSSTFKQIQADKDRGRSDEAARQAYIRSTETATQKQTRLNKEVNSARKGSADYYKALGELGQAQRSAVKGVGGGGAGAASPKLSGQQKLNNGLQLDQTKFQNRAEDLEGQHVKKLQSIDQQHTQNVQKIWENYYNKRKAADQRFNQSSLDSRASFYLGLADVEDKGTRESLAKRYEQIAQDTAAIARTQGSDAAQAYQDAAEKGLQSEAAIEQRIAEAKKKKNQDDVTYLTGVLGLQRAADAQRLADTQAAGSDAANERDKALADEQAKTNETVLSEQDRYAEAYNGIATDADRSAQRQVQSAQLAGKAVGETRTQVQGLQTDYANLQAQTGLPPTTVPPSSTPPAPVAPGAQAATSAAIMAVRDSDLLTAVQAQSSMQAGKFDAVIAGLTSVQREVASLRSARDGTV